MRNATFTSVAVITAALAFSSAAFAQSNQTPGLDRREARQESRIQEGRASGELTRREAARLEAREARLRADEAAAKADGRVTMRERQRLQGEANRDSARIYRQKHDRQTRG